MNSKRKMKVYGAPAPSHRNLLHSRGNKQASVCKTTREITLSRTGAEDRPAASPPLLVNVPVHGAEQRAEVTLWQRRLLVDIWF
jgi:hypothetical protein